MTAQIQPAPLSGLIYARLASIRVPTLDALLYSAAGLVILLIGSWVPDERLNIAGLPLDTILLTAIVLFATTAKVTMRAWSMLLLIQLPLLLLAISLLWSPDPFVGLDKLTTLTVSTAVAFVCFCTVIEKHGEEELIRILLAYLTVLLLLALVYKLIFGFFNRQVPFFINGAIVFARYMCVAAILASFYLQGRLRWLAVAVFSIAVLWTESKGPILALFATFVAIIYWHVQQKYRLWIIAAVLGALVTIALVANYYGVEARDLGRLGVLYALATGDIDVLDTSLALGSVQTRVEIWVLTIPLIAERPLGVGLGGWPYYVTLMLAAPHPHNLFLELWSEAGIVIGSLAAIPFLCFLFVKNRNAIWYSALLLFIAQQVSGDIADARFLLTFALLSMLPRRNISS